MKLVTLALAAAMSTAQAAPGGTPGARQAQLTAALKKKDYKQLQQLMLSAATPADIKANLDWQRAQMLGGATSLVSMWYATSLWGATNLWGASNHLPPGPADELRETAAFAALYAYAAIRIDGSRCADVSAPRKRREQVLVLLRPIWTFVGTLPPEKRARLVDMAIKLDHITAARRAREGDDAFLCREGLDELAYNLKRGRGQEVPTPPGGIGRTIAVDSDGTYKPRIVAASVWKPMAAQQRAELPQVLTQIVNAAK